MLDNLFNWGVVIVVVAAILSAAIKIIPEYERAVLFRLGRLVSVRGPGLIVIIPIIDKIIRISLRVTVFDVPSQEVITRDNVTCRVNAVLYYRVIAPDKAVVNVEEYREATNQLAQTTLRSVIGTADLDELLSRRDKLNHTIQVIVDEATDSWGIKVTAVEIKDVVLPVEMQRAIARQAEAERNRGRDHSGRRRTPAAERLSAPEFQRGRAYPQDAPVLNRYFHLREYYSSFPLTYRTQKDFTGNREDRAAYRPE